MGKRLFRQVQEKPDLAVLTDRFKELVGFDEKRIHIHGLLFDGPAAGVCGREKQHIPHKRRHAPAFTPYVFQILGLLFRTLR